MTRVDVSSWLDREYCRERVNIASLQLDITCISNFLGWSPYSILVSGGNPTIGSIVLSQKYSNVEIVPFDFSVNLYRVGNIYIIVSLCGRERIDDWEANIIICLLLNRLQVSRSIGLFFSRLSRNPCLKCYKWKRFMLRPAVLNLARGTTSWLPRESLQSCLFIYQQDAELLFLFLILNGMTMTV